MTLDQARAVLADPILRTRADLVLALDAALRELDRREAHTFEDARQRMLSAS